MIYIQSTKEKDRPYHFDTSCAMFGAIETGQKYLLVTLEEVSSGKFDRLIESNLFVGSVEFMETVFSRVGLTDVRLHINSTRPTYIHTLDEAFRMFEETKEPIFIKPVKVKEFGAAILDGTKHSHLEKVSGSSIVYVYSVFESPLVSEWRVYVKNHKMVDSRNYSGDWTISPDYNFVNNIINNTRLGLPSSYTLDVGILQNGKTVDVEFNDMWAIGNYGLPNDIYLSMLKLRYFEIIKNK